MSADEWYCFKDKVKMDKVKLKMFYREYSYGVDQLMCPSCGLQFVTEETCKSINKGEKIIDKKAKKA
jgi:hypothetical protein